MAEIHDLLNARLSPARCQLDQIHVVLPLPRPGSTYTSATGRLMAVSDGYDPIGPLTEKDAEGHQFHERVNIGCPVCGAYVLIVASDYKHTDQIRTRCLLGCRPDDLAREIVARVQRLEGQPK